MHPDVECSTGRYTIYTEADLRKEARSVAKQEGIQLSGLKWMVKIWRDDRVSLWVYGKPVKGSKAADAGMTVTSAMVRI